MSSGRLERGVIKKGDEAVIMGHNTQSKTTITGMSLDRCLTVTALCVISVNSVIASVLTSTVVQDNVAVKLLGLLMVNRLAS